MKEKKKKSATDGAKVMPRMKREITKFLNSEEAKITSKNLVTGSVVLLGLGIAATEALAAHTSHGNYTQDHYNTTGHGNQTTHASDNAEHSSIAPHHSAAPHSDTSALGVAHVSGHANGGYSEATTKGALHNDATAGYGKHSAGTGHYNLPTLVNNNVNVSGAGHASTTPHSNTAIHSSTGHHASASNPNDHVQHYNMHASGADGHGSHASHGQW
ncbi:MAG: hypothetical protein ABIH66_13795 [bacterium]